MVGRVGGFIWGGSIVSTAPHWGYVNINEEEQSWGRRLSWVSGEGGCASDSPRVGRNHGPVKAVGCVSGLSFIKIRGDNNLFWATTQYNDLFKARIMHIVEEIGRK